MKVKHSRWQYINTCTRKGPLNNALPVKREAARAVQHVSAALLPDHSAATRPCRHLFAVHLKEERRSVLKINERVAANRGTSATGSPAQCSAARQKAETPASSIASCTFTLFTFAFPPYKKRTSPQ